MPEINKDPRPEILLEQITNEAIFLASVAGSDPENTKLHEQNIRLIGEAWQLPEEQIQSSLDRIEAARTAMQGKSFEGDADHGLPSGPQILELLWGFFNTAVRLRSYENRDLILQMAVYLTDSLGLEDCIMEPQPVAGEAAPWAESPTGAEETAPVTAEG